MLKDRISTLKKNNRYYKYCLIAIVILAIIATRAAYKRGVQNASNDIISPIPSQDAKTYIYCGVVFQSKAKVYHYRTNDTTIKEGDEVVVPVGKQQEEVIATVVSVGRYTAQNAPYPLNRTRFIIRKHND